MKKTSTLEDIARTAGVSPSTVSRVLNGSKRVADDKRALVLAAIEQYGYRPNLVARGLVRGRSMIVGVVMQDISSPFFARMVSGIEQGLDQAEYQPMFVSTHWRSGDQESEARSLQLLIERRVDGIIVLASSIPDDELRAVAARLPLVVVARSVPGIEEQCLSFDNQGGAYRATRYLLGLGHTRIAHLAGTPGHPDATDRLVGYRRALDEGGLAFDPQLVVAGDFTEGSGLTAVEQLLARGERFTAIFAANDQMAYGAMLGLYNHGYRIPSDVSLVGFDDQFLSAYTLPPLTTIRQPSTAMGQAAAAGILRLLRGEAALLPRFPAELVIRKSAMYLRQPE
ncbi:MAG TPA: substrate-binding domain-containing protein [Roseiflexaceae bacterium]|nr:substrate-binding domain-containing protein [Roseiflexaceae bacterium]